MKRYLILPAVLLSLAVALPGCATVQRTWDTVTSVQVSPRAVIVAVNSFNALKATATNYIRLPRCTATNKPVCRDPQVAAILIPAIDSGTIARNGLREFYRTHPSESLGSQGLYDALVVSNKTIESINARYRIGVR